jgi:glycerophosphoryl diester phosphodiesterase
LEKSQEDFDNLKRKINFNKLSTINLNDIIKLNYNELSKLNFDEIKTIPLIKEEIELIKPLNRDNEFDIKIYYKRKNNTPK